MTDTEWDTPVLFDEFPALKKLPWQRIGTLPTPVDEFPDLAAKLGVGRLFIKRDDLTSPIYGGNKVRKLEFLIADAKRMNMKSLLTVGGIGSNHLLATTIHGAENGFRTHGVVVPQPVTPHVKKNLLLYQHYGTVLHLANGEPAVPGVAVSVMASNMLKGEPTYFVPFGGSSTLGATGYVEAVFELKRQIQEGLLPEPDYIFTASGSSGTAAGLNVGVMAAGLKTHVVSVQVADLATDFLLAQLATFTCARLKLTDMSFPFKIFTTSDLDHRVKYFGGRYGVLTPEGIEAMEMMGEHTGLKFEGVYTGKAAAAMIDAARRGELSGKNVLYWHTFNSVDLTDKAAQHEYTELPKKFHKFFECQEHTCESA